MDPLWTLMTEQGRTQAWLAKRARVSRSLLSKAKHGKRVLKPEIRSRIAEALALPEAALFRGGKAA